MAGFFLIGMLAAFGTVCALWTLVSGVLPGDRGGVILCTGGEGLPELGFIRRCLLLERLGILRCRIIVMDLGLDEGARGILESHRGKIEICRPEAVPAALELERREFG